jgi:hypothetical protein
MAAIEGMIEITPKITPTSIATSLRTPDPATETTTPNATTGLETIGLDKRGSLTPDTPDV